MSRPPSAIKRPGWHWSEYWQAGHVEVMTVDTRDGRKAFDFQSVWSSYFAGFAGGARLIDLATGGGQVARYASAAAHAQGKAFEVIGVDYAELASEPVPGVTLMGGVSLEKLPFPAADFDGASSQFGIEYADSRLALGELSRVLKPGGRALMLIHHADSVVGRWTAEQSAAFDRVLGDGALFRQARRAFEAHLKRSRPAAILAAEQAFRASVGKAQGKMEPTPAFATARGYVDYLADLAQQIAVYEPTSALSRLGDVEHGATAWRQRNRNQSNVSLDEAALNAFVQRAERAGLACIARTEAKDPSGEVIAWQVEFQRER